VVLEEPALLRTSLSQPESEYELDRRVGPSEQRDFDII